MQLVYVNGAGGYSSAFASATHLTSPMVVLFSLLPSIPRHIAPVHTHPSWISPLPLYITQPPAYTDRERSRTAETLANS